MTPWDVALSLLILLWPIWEHRVGLPRLRAALASGRPGALARAYTGTIALQWSLAALALAVWTIPGRPLEQLGLRWPGGWRAALGGALVLTLIVMLVRQERAIKRDPAMKERVRPQLESVAWFLPRTIPERDRFMSLSVTAGICEELLCRGWFLALLAPWIPPLVTLIATSVFFGLGHFYQGQAGIIKTGVTGLIMGSIFLLTDSLLFPMALHAALDIGSGRVAYLVLTEPPTPGYSPP